MRTIEEAIAEETGRYVAACADHLRHLAHIRRLALQRLRHQVVTEHEALRMKVGA